MYWVSFPIAWYCNICWVQLSAENNFFLNLKHLFCCLFHRLWTLLPVRPHHYPSPHCSSAPQSKGRYLHMGPPKYGAGTCPFNQFLMGRSNSYCLHTFIQILMLQFINVQHKSLCLFMYGHYFIWQQLVAVSHLLVYRICVVHSTDCACIQQEVTGRL